MEQSLIDKYLAGENTPKEAQQLKLLLEAKPGEARSPEEQALLLMLTGIGKQSDDDIFSTDYSDEYEDVVRKNRKYRLVKVASVVMAIAACFALVWFVGTHQRGNTNSLPTISKHQATPTRQKNSPAIFDKSQADSDSVTTPLHQAQPEMHHLQPDANHYAWAKGLIESYKEDDLGEITDMADATSNSPKEDERDWAKK
jgi:hypothetical protein